MKTSPAIAQAITEQLGAAIGIDAGSLDVARLQWIIASRCRHLHLNDAATYAAHLEAAPEELDALVEEVVVQETRFFRDPAVFEHIRHFLPKLADSFPGPLRVLSAPCGTGQEAYSLAATMVEMGLPPARFSIDAFDISSGAIATARGATYPESALQHLSPQLRERCGTRQQKHWKMHDTLCGRIHFERRNLAEPESLGSAPQYHLILCRNLFIYLRPQARAALAQSLAAALIPGGRLVIGTADRVEELNSVFAPVRPAASFAFTHRGPVSVPAARHDRKISAHAPAPKRVVHAAKPPHAPAPERKPITAAELCQHALEHQRHGNLRKAERQCRQALYLEPAFLPALELLETLWRQQPNVRMRRALIARILRTRLATQANEPIADMAARWKETA